MVFLRHPKREKKYGKNIFSENVLFIGWLFIIVLYH